MRGSRVILIGIGGNLASAAVRPAAGHARRRPGALDADGIRIAARSAWYRSEPVPRSDQPWFVNAVASLTTGLAARDLLAVLQVVETQFGRVRGEPNAARILDLDLLDYQGQVIDTTSLVLPHPRLHERRFVLDAARRNRARLAPPAVGVTAEQLLSRLAAEAAVVRLPC